MKKGEVQASKWDVLGKDLFSCSNVVYSLPAGTKEPPNNVDGWPKPDGREGTTFNVWHSDTRGDLFSKEELALPVNDPCEYYSLLNLSVYNKQIPELGDKPTMEGFAQQFYNKEAMTKEKVTTDFSNAKSPAMHVFLPEQAQVFTDIAEHFAISDTYFSAAPAQTWPNRLFAVTGHCYGYINNMPNRPDSKIYEEDSDIEQAKVIGRMLQFDDSTIFDRLLEKGVEWAIYHGGFPLSVILCRKLHTLDMLERTYLMDDFKAHAAAGTLPPFTWIEPRYLGLPFDLGEPTDMHPPHNILPAQQLVASIYEALRGNEEVWRHTLFIVNCDEGVGLFDHVPPPAAPPPDRGLNHEFLYQPVPDKASCEGPNTPFARYGTRTPCLLASPLLEPGAVIRPDGDYPFDHTSVIRTVFDLFVNPEEHLTNRDKLAPSFAPHLRSRARADLGPRQLRPVPEIQQDYREYSTHTCHGAGFLHKTCTTSPETHVGKAFAAMQPYCREGRTSHVKKS